MTTANAWHQANYRRAQHGRNARRLNTIIDGEVKKAVERLARYYGLTQRDIIERVLYDVEGRIMADMTPGEREQYLTP